MLKALAKEPATATPTPTRSSRDLEAARVAARGARGGRQHGAFVPVGVAAPAAAAPPPPPRRGAAGSPPAREPTPAAGELPPEKPPRRRPQRCSARPARCAAAVDRGCLSCCCVRDQKRRAARRSGRRSTARAGARAAGFKVDIDRRSRPRSGRHRLPPGPEREREGRRGLDRHPVRVQRPSRSRCRTCSD